MIMLANIIRTFVTRLQEKYHLDQGQESALAAMMRCRQPDGPQMLARCSDHNCGQYHYVPHSCGHRICPHCQNHESQQWIENQLGRLLPACYFLITFTLPHQLRALTRQHQQEIYSLMFSCMQQTLKTFIANDKHLGGKAGFTAVLHTHSRRLNFHPHIHVVMPAASIDTKKGLWRRKRGNYIFSHKALAKVFRAKLLEGIVKCGLRVPGDCPREWVVDCKDVGRGDKALIYLGRYLYKGVVQEKQIVWLSASLQQESHLADSACASDQSTQTVSKKSTPADSLPALRKTHGDH